MLNVWCGRDRVRVAWVYGMSVACSGIGMVVLVGCVGVVSLRRVWLRIRTHSIVESSLVTHSIVEYSIV